MIQKIKELIFGSAGRFVLVGIVNTLVGSAIMFGLFNFAGCSYWFSSAANYTLTSILSFFLNKHFTFKNKEKSVAQVIKFALNIAVCYILAYSVAKPLVYSLLAGASDFVRDNGALLTGMVIFTGLNYLSQRFIIFGKSKDE